MRVIAIVKASSAEERNDLLSVAMDAVPSVREEPGCLSYEVFTSGSRTIVFEEEWADGEVLRAHAAGKPFTGLMAALEERGLKDSFQVLPILPVA